MLSSIRGATFIKVGHHGSHNATSKTLVEQVLPKQIPPVISGLLDALKVRNINYARSDQAAVPAPLQRGDGAKWIDVELPC